MMAFTADPHFPILESTSGSRMKKYLLKQGSSSLYLIGRFLPVSILMSVVSIKYTLTHHLLDFCIAITWIGIYAILILITSFSPASRHAHKISMLCIVIIRAVVFVKP